MDQDQPLPVGWPVRGLALDRGYGHQPPDSTILGKNVRVCEPSTMRLRGGSRPGLSRYAAQVPSGSGLIQELNYVVIASADALDGGIDDPGAPVVPNESSPGPSSSWGYYPDGSQRQTRSPQDTWPTGGTGFSPSKNTKQTHHLTIYGPSSFKNFSDTVTWTPGEPFFTGFLAPADTLTATYSSAGDAAMSPVGTYAVNVSPTLTSHTGEVYVIDKIVPGTLVVDPDPPPTKNYCWQGQLTIQITKTGPDPSHFNGLTVDFVGVCCASAQPGTSETCKTNSVQEGLPIGTLLLVLAARWLLNHVGPDSYGTVTSDLVSSAHSVTECTTNDGSCGGSSSPNQAASPGAVGAIIAAG